MHVDEDLAQLAIVIFTGAEIDLMAAHHRLLCVALAAIGQLQARTLALHYPLDDFFDHCFDPGRDRLGHQRLGHVVGVLVVIGQELRRERLRQLGAVAVERVGLDGQLPRQHVGAGAVFHGCVVRHVDGLGDGP